MKKITGLLLCCTLFIISAAAQGIKKIKITDLQTTIRQSKTPLIINFWATYCIPCLEELPYFQQQVKAHAKDSVQLLLVSLDMADEYPSGIRSFAKKRKITAPIVWLDETNADYFCPKVDEKWSGAIPASLFVNNANGHRQLYEEQLSPAALQKAILTMLGRE